MISARFPAQALRLFTTLVGVAFCLFLCQKIAMAQTLTLSNLVMDNQRGALTLRFSLTVNELERLRALLQDGTTLALKCQIKLSRKREYLPAKTLVDAEARQVLSGEPLSQEFVLEFDQQQAMRNKDLAKLLGDAWGHMEINLGPFSLLERGASYSVALDVSLIEANVPAWMRWALFFKSWEVAPSAVYRMDFEF
jgi:hypothetical protein